MQIYVKNEDPQGLTEKAKSHILPPPLAPWKKGRMREITDSQNNLA